MSRSGATALVVLASVLLVGATVAGYARLAFFNSGQFADRASAALAQPAVREPRSASASPTRSCCAMTPT